MNPDVNHGLWVTVMSESGLISCTKGATGCKEAARLTMGAVGVGPGSTSEFSEPPPPFCCEPRTDL